MQRDRDFANYQDDGAFYNKRPGIWVEPKGDWGAGAVMLVEIPTDDEIQDNIVAFWRPTAWSHAGRQMSFDYRLLLAGQRARPIPTPLLRWWRRGWAGAAFPAPIPGRATSTNSWWISPAAR